jgi:hypothetical protein
MDIGNKEIENAYTRFTEVISVNTAGNKKVLCICVNMMCNMMCNIGNLEIGFQ